MEGKRKDSARDLVLINAAAAIYVGGKAENLSEGLKFAAESLESGKALDKLETLIKSTMAETRPLRKCVVYVFIAKSSN